MKYYLKEDIISYSNTMIYGRKGEVVTFISDHDNCVCVEGENGQKFGVRKDRLSNDKIEKEIIIQQPQKTKNAKRK